MRLRAGLAACALVALATGCVAANHDARTVGVAPPTSAATSAPPSGSGSSGSGSSGSGSSGSGSSGSGSPVAVPVPKPGATMIGPTPCPNAGGLSSHTTSFSQAPQQCIDRAKTYKALVTTNVGAFTITLDQKEAPIAVNNFVVLALYHFYDGISFHRIVPDFVDQVGDPTETGTGGPGYDLPDENAKRAYRAGDVAMARSNVVSGSQLFLTIDPTGLNASRDAGQPDYPIIGEITSGFDIVEKIDTYGTNDENGQPTKVVTIESIKITAS